MPFPPAATAASTLSKPTALFRSPVRASSLVSKLSPNSSIPPSKSLSKPNPLSSSSRPKRAPPAPPPLDSLSHALRIDACACGARGPSLIERQSSQNQQQPNRGTAGPLQPNIEC